MKMRSFIVTMLFCFAVTSTANAQEPVFFKSVTPCDVLQGVGLYVKEVGCKTVDGAKGIVKGAGKIVTAPFKSRLNWPNARMFRFERGHWVPPKIKMLPKPPNIEMGVPLEPKGNLIFPLHRELDNQYFVKVISFNF